MAVNQCPCQTSVVSRAGLLCSQLLLLDIQIVAVHCGAFHCVQVCVASIGNKAAVTQQVGASSYKAFVRQWLSVIPEELWITEIYFLTFVNEIKSHMLKEIYKRIDALMFS